MLFTLSIPSIFPMTSKWGCMEEELDNWKATALQVPVPGYLLDLGASNVHGYLALSHLGILIPALTQTKLCPEDKRLSAQLWRHLQHRFQGWLLVGGFT